MRSGMVVVTDPELAVGFRLAGVEVAEAASPAEAEEIVQRIVLGSDVGLVAVSEEFQRHFGEGLRQLLREAAVPLVVPFPGKEAYSWKVEDRLGYVADLIRSAIGYHIKLTR